MVILLKIEKDKTNLVWTAKHYNSSTDEYRSRSKHIGRKSRLMGSSGHFSPGFPKACSER